MADSSLIRAARQAAAFALDLLYPPRCVACGRFGAPLCLACRATCIPATGDERCFNCGAEWDAPSFCPRCVAWDALDRGLAAFEHEGVARRAIHALKYSRTRTLARPMAEAIAVLRTSEQFDYAAAVPLHRSRQKRRGFNQAGVILSALEWPRLPGRLERAHRTDSQVGRSLAERRRNVAGAFAYRGPELEGATIALVDDVITTGSTANECARVLKDYGAGRVVAFASTRASYPLSDGPIND